MGHMPGAMAHPARRARVGDRGAGAARAEVVIYCASGNRSALAADVLQQMGYEEVASMRGGIRGWSDAGGEIEG
jgi:rhodanese-related sulfurtransferase